MFIATTGSHDKVLRLVCGTASKKLLPEYTLYSERGRVTDQQSDGSIFELL